MMTTMDPWIPILNQLKLSRSEKMVVERYQSAPDGRTFLPIADILLSHQMVDECIELLMQGVTRHPRFTVARVILARELFNKGMMLQAWNTLTESPESLQENVLAQKIRFKLALVLGKEKMARDIYQHIYNRRLYDDETKHWGDRLAHEDFHAVARSFVEELRRGGIRVLDYYPELTSAPKVVQETLAAQPTPKEDVIEEDSELMKLSGYHVVPLREIFALAMDEEERRINGGIELDSTTLAEIYESQGHYAKALDIYRRLLKVSPNNEYLKRKVAETNRLRLEQKQEDLSIDPSVLDQMESMEILNTQIRYLNDLLTRIH